VDRTSREKLPRDRPSNGIVTHINRDKVDRYGTGVCDVYLDVSNAELFVMTARDEYVVSGSAPAIGSVEDTYSGRLGEVSVYGIPRDNQDAVLVQIKHSNLVVRYLAEIGALYF